MRTVSVSFQHWQHMFSEATLTKYGSPYFAKNKAGAALMEEVYAQASRVKSLDTTFTYDQIICGNEAFPEAAVADPIADLDVWDEWRSGIRSFPYPGRYTRLGIARQEDKTSSPSSVGVLGEIMAGFFAQVGISPWVLVRVVRRWPDFIFADQGRVYSFVESKAFTTGNENGTGLQARVDDAEMREGLWHAVRQLNSDPFVKVWYAFTRIFDIKDMRLDVTFLELDVPAKRRDRFETVIIPAVVAQGIAERAIHRATAKMAPEEVDYLDYQSKVQKVEVLSRVRPLAEQEIRELLAETHVEADDRDFAEITRAVNEQLQRLRKRKPGSAPATRPEGRRFFDLKRQAIEGRLSALRPVGKQVLYFADLPRSACNQLETDWASDWKFAAAPWGELGEVRLWRCGGSVFCVGAEGLEGECVPNRRGPI